MLRFNEVKRCTRIKIKPEQTTNNKEPTVLPVMFSGNTVGLLFINTLFICCLLLYKYLPHRQHPMKNRNPKLYE